MSSENELSVSPGRVGARTQGDGGGMGWKVIWIAIAFGLGLMCLQGGVGGVCVEKVWCGRKYIFDAVT